MTADQIEARLRSGAEQSILDALWELARAPHGTINYGDLPTLIGHLWMQKNPEIRERTAFVFGIRHSNSGLCASWQQLFLEERDEEVVVALLGALEVCAGRHHQTPSVACLSRLLEICLDVRSEISLRNAAIGTALRLAGKLGLSETSRREFDAETLFDGPDVEEALAWLRAALPTTP